MPNLHRRQPAPSRMPTDIRALLLDLDNCVAPDSNTRITEVWFPDFAREFNLTLDEVKTLNTGFFAHGCSARGFAAHFGRDAAWVEHIYASHAQTTGENFARTHTACTRLRAAAERLARRGIRLGTFTQAHPVHADILIKAIGLDDLIPHHRRWHRLNVPHSKREPAAMRAVLYQLDLAPEYVMMFEDSPHNLVPLVKAGGHGVVIGPADTRPLANYPHWRFTTPADAMEAAACA